MIFPDSCPSNQVELKRRECDFVGLLRCVCHQGLRDGVHSISEAEAGTRYEPQLGPVNATPFHTTLIGVIPRGRTDWIIVMQGSWGVTPAHNRGGCIIEQSCRCSPAAASSPSSPCLRGRVCFRRDMTSFPCQTLTIPSQPMVEAISGHASRYEEYDCLPRLLAAGIGAYEWACRAGSYGYDVGWPPSAAL